MPTLTPETAQIIYSPGTPVLSSVITTGAGTQLIIGGTSYGLWRKSTFRIQRNLASGVSASVDLNYYGDGIPEELIGQEIALFVDGTKRLGGLISDVEVDSRPDDLNFSVLKLTITGFESYTSRRIVAALYTPSMGGLPGILVYVLWQTYLQEFGITKDGDFGPAVVLGNQIFHYITLTEAFKRIKDQVPGWDEWIDDNKELHFTNTLAGGPDAPFVLSRASRAAKGFTVKASSKRFRNRQWVVPAGDLKALWTDEETGDGSLTSFPTTYVQNEPPIVTVGGVEQIVTELGTWPAGWEAYYIPGGLGVFFASPPAGAAAIKISYASPFPLGFKVEDAASIAAVGLYESVYFAKNAQDEDTCLAIGQGLLDAFGAAGAFPRQINYSFATANDPRMEQDWLTPGMVQEVDWTFPNVTGNYVVEQVSSEEHSFRLWVHTITLRNMAGEVTEDQIEQEIVNGATRVPLISPPEFIHIEPDIDGAGYQVGELPSKNRYVMPEDGVFTYWQAINETDPPTGSDAIFDLYLNGVSIFPTESPVTNAKKIRFRDGVTTLQSGIEYRQPNLGFVKGDILTGACLAIGSTNPGKYGTIRQGVKYKQATH